MAIKVLKRLAVEPTPWDRRCNHAALRTKNGCAGKIRDHKMLQKANVDIGKLALDLIGDLHVLA